MSGLNSFSCKSIQVVGTFLYKTGFMRIFHVYSVTLRYYKVCSKISLVIRHQVDLYRFDHNAETCIAKQDTIRDAMNILIEKYMAQSCD